GLLWCLIWYGVFDGRPILTFFLACVVVAGVSGGVTASRRILLVQALPAAIAAALLWLGCSSRGKVELRETALLATFARHPAHRTLEHRARERERVELAVLTANVHAGHTD